MAVSGLDAAEGGALQHARVVGVAHAGVALDTDVDALSRPCKPLFTPYGGICAAEAYRRVGAPNIDVRVRHRSAGLVVDDLDGQRKLDACLALRVVLADLLALHVCCRPVSRKSFRRRPFANVQSGPWSTIGIMMQAPVVLNRVEGSVALVTVLLLL